MLISLMVFVALINGILCSDSPSRLISTSSNWISNQNCLITCGTSFSTGLVGGLMHGLNCPNSIVAASAVFITNSMLFSDQIHPYLCSGDLQIMIEQLCVGSAGYFIGHKLGSKFRKVINEYCNCFCSNIRFYKTPSKNATSSEQDAHLEWDEVYGHYDERTMEE